MFVSEKEIEIRYAETDQMGVVYHANYVIWLELGRTQLIHDLGFSVTKFEEDGYLSPVMNINVSYKAAMRYGEKAIIRTWVKSQDRLRTVYAYEILHTDGTVAATATSEHIVVKKESFRPVPFNRVDEVWFNKYKEIAEIQQ
ncbi:MULTISPECIES: thioesterase family protein [unclassified Rummeliibacillus]|uniref:acyl-CoA thioesterase n=1 Tax=unclassified Rummeliibacillus TaxID=2622809 RepID=UPI000E674089|nr:MULTISPECIES: thioesterase family protein [unclassified Rummeliibacillus]RIJ64869.1 acyl-CoA thioesterase [Rummeliibacillus sp. POC4]RPJ97148.1 acyl-CoA thioesterase [Rummeliibacillus sp. TYF005]